MKTRKIVNLGNVIICLSALLMLIFLPVLRMPFIVPVLGFVAGLWATFNVGVSSSIKEQIKKG